MSTQTPTTPGTRVGTGNRSLTVIAIGILVLTAAAVVVVLVTGGRSTEFTAGSPEAALQAYLAAYEADDPDATYALFSAEVQSSMDREAYGRAVDAQDGFAARSSRRVLFDRATGSGDATVLHLTVEEFVGDGLSSDTYRSPREVRMVRESGAWRVDEALVWLDPASIFNQF